MRLKHRLSPISAIAIAVAGASTASAAPLETISRQTTNQVEESRFVPIGGIRQWVTISGRDLRNTIVLFVHGGPGNPLSPYSKSLYGGWTGDFTIVQWDQRGAGRSFEVNPQSSNEQLTIERMTQDGIEVVEYITRRLGQPKVLLVGGSWGSALGVHMAKRRPDLFHAYVGVGQLVSENANQAASLRSLRGLAAASKDQSTLDAIAALGAPPWTNPRNFGRLRKLARTYEAKVVDPAPASWWAPESAYASEEYERAYEAGEDYSYIQFVGQEGGGLISTIDLSKLGPEFAVPIYLIQGSEDLVTAPDVSRAWFDTIEAPDKRYVLVERAGHDPNPPLLAATFDLLKRVSAASANRK